MAENFDEKKIMDIALKEFALHGFAGTRIEAIAKKAGYSYGSVYYHYKSKEILYQMVTEYALQPTLGIFLNIPPDGDAFALFQETMAAYSAVVCTSSGAASLLLFYDVLISPSAPDAARLFVKRKFNAINESLASLISRARTQGHFQSSTDAELVQIINSLMIGGAFLKISKIGAPPSADAVLGYLSSLNASRKETPI